MLSAVRVSRNSSQALDERPMAAVLIISLFLSLGLLSPSIRSVIVIQQPTERVQYGHMVFLVYFVCLLVLFLPVGGASRRS